MSTSSKHQKHRHQWSTIVPDTDRDDRGEIRRCWDPETQPSLGVHGCRTSYEVFRRGVALNPLGPCMGFRAVSTTGFATPYIYSSYKECLARSNAFAAGLDALHLVEPNSHAGYKCLGLYLSTFFLLCCINHAFLFFFVAAVFLQANASIFVHFCLFNI